MRSPLPTLAAIAVVVFCSTARIPAADFNFFGRSGDAIEINLGAIPGINPGSSFSSLNTTGFANHTVLTSDLLTAQTFSTSGRLWLFANPARDTTAPGLAVEVLGAGLDAGVRQPAGTLVVRRSRTLIVRR